MMAGRHAIKHETKIPLGSLSADMGQKQILPDADTVPIDAIEAPVAEDVSPDEVISLTRGRKIAVGAFLAVAAVSATVASFAAYHSYEYYHPPAPEGPRSLVVTPSAVTASPVPSIKLTPSPALSPENQPSATALPIPSPLSVHFLASSSVGKRDIDLLPMSGIPTSKFNQPGVKAVELKPPDDYHTFYLSDYQPTLIAAHSSYHGHVLAGQWFHLVKPGDEFTVTTATDTRTYKADTHIVPDKVTTNLQTAIFDKLPKTDVVLVTCSDKNNDFNDIMPAELISVQSN